jgi:hypothetical protein
VVVVCYSQRKVDEDEVQVESFTGKVKRCGSGKRWWRTDEVVERLHERFAATFDDAQEEMQEDT